MLKLFCNLIRCMKSKKVYEKEMHKTICNFKRKIGCVFEKYTSFNQEDSVEFYKNILNCLLIEFQNLVKPSKNFEILSQIEFYVDYNNDNYILEVKEKITNYRNEFYTNEDFLTILYEGLFLNEYFCSICGMSTLSLEKFIDITLQSFGDGYSTKEIDLINLLELFFGMQDYGKEGIPCSCCNQMGILNGKKYIACLPRIISITIDRGDFYNNRKDKRKIKTFSHIDFSKFSILEDSANFEMFSSIIHFGGLTYGHYINISRIKNGWMQFNDNSKSLSDQKSAIENSNFLLFFRK